VRNELVIFVMDCRKWRDIPYHTDIDLQAYTGIDSEYILVIFPQPHYNTTITMDITMALHSRVLIIEGISGSGKDTFQKYLREKLDRSHLHLHDYSEGEVLHSWKHLQINGIFKVRVKFMKHFVNHVRDVVSRDENAIFLLNRFHLSAYVSTITQEPKLEGEYNEIINILRTLPAHVFILQLDEHEIEERSLHSERSNAWRKHQKQIVTREGFRDRLERYLWQQRLILEAAKKQQIPYSVIKFSCARENWIGKESSM
jgi:thymidylate kinase